MDAFSYNNIFETKGVEYIIIITFLVLVIPFWIILTRKSRKAGYVRSAERILTVDNINISQGLFYNRNHTWAHLARTGNAKVGLDDFLLHITGEVIFRNLKKSGDFMSKGELMAVVSQKGKFLQITSPLSGRIVKANTLLSDGPKILNDDLYLKGWIYEVIPTDWIEETGSYFLAHKAVEWSKRELVRFKDFMAETVRKSSAEGPMLVLQDGGEIFNQPLSEQPPEVWHDFQKTFLN